VPAERDASVSPWAKRALNLVLAVPAVAFAAAAIFAVVVMPYRLWDSLAFGAWSRAIADGGGPLSSAGSALFLHRPLFYVEQGLAWRVVDEEWVGRLLSLSFTGILALAIWVLAAAASSRPDGRSLLPPLALGTVLASSVVATYAAAGMSDVPVAALVAATGAAIWADRIGPARVVLVAVLAAAAVLAKPTALLAFAGLAPALLLLRGHRAARSLAALAAGILVALAYDAWQASRLNVAFADFLTAGNDEFWRERGAAARWDALARAEWFGPGLRLLVLFGIVHVVARSLGAGPRVAVGVGGGIGITWSVVGPLVADGSLGYPFDGSIVGVALWLVFATAIAVAARYARDDPVSRRTHAALLLWMAPVALAWGWQRADEVRHLAPAWAPIALVTAAALASVSLALARLRPTALLVPATALAVLVLANVPSIDGLGREGWRGLLDLGPTGWGDRAEMENYAFGPFSYELNLAREHAGDDGRIVSSNGRLSYYFPGRVELRYVRACLELEDARFFSFLTSGESLEFAQREGQPTDPLGWIQCAKPRVELIGEQQGIYAAFVVGGPPARAPAPEDCRIASSPGHLSDAVFGERLGYAEARELRLRMEAIGYEGMKTERTNCSEFRVVVTGIPDDERVRDEFQAQARANGFTVAYEPAVRYPEVPPDVPPVE
jgi:hypothetical protein